MLLSNTSFSVKMQPKDWRPATSQPTNILPQDVLTTFPSNVSRTSLKDPIWPSRGRPKLTSRGPLNLKSWEHLKMTSRVRPNPPSLGGWFRTSPGCSQDVPGRYWKHVLGTVWDRVLNVPKFLFTFLFEFIRLTKSI